MEFRAAPDEDSFSELDLTEEVEIVAIASTLSLDEAVSMGWITMENAEKMVSRSNEIYRLLCEGFTMRQNQQTKLWEPSGDPSDENRFGTTMCDCPVCRASRGEGVNVEVVREWPDEDDDQLDLRLNEEDDDDGKN